MKKVPSDYDFDFYEVSWLIEVSLKLFDSGEIRTRASEETGA